MKAARSHALRRHQEEEEEAAKRAQSAVTLQGGDFAVARKQWEMSNDIMEVTSDAFWGPDQAHMDAVRKEKPWRKDMHYFTSVKVSALAALKMFIHAKRGSPDMASGRRDWFEVMGLMLGHFKGPEMVVTDSFGLPVDASEVECSMNENSEMYMVDYLDYHRRLGKPDRGCIGWYHSHPGYTCFLSGIDVNTQQVGQMAQDPWVAIVVDPVRTISTGRLDLKAFRTYTEQYARANRPEGQTGNFDVPTERVKEYGVHAHRYYELPITIVRSTSDEQQLNGLLGEYWALTFSTNPLLANRNFNTSQVRQAARLMTAHKGKPPRANKAADLQHLRRDRAKSGVEDPYLLAVYEDVKGPYGVLGSAPQKNTAAAVGAEGESEEDTTAAKGKEAGASGSDTRAQQLSQLARTIATEQMLGGMQLAVKQHTFGDLASI